MTQETAPECSVIDARIELERDVSAVLAHVLERLEQAEIPVCVVRNRDRIPSSLLTGSDVDLIVPADTSPLALIRLLVDLHPVHVAIHRSTMEAYLAVGEILLHLDFLISDRQWRGARYLANREILRHVWVDRGIPVASPVDQAFCAWFSSLLRTRHFKTRYTELIGKAVAEYPQPMQERLTTALGKRLGDQLLEIAQSQRWGELDALAGRCRRAVWTRALVRRPLSTIAGFCRHYTAELRRWLRPPGLTVAVLGPDGAGKSTVCALLGQMPRSRFPFRSVEAKHLYDRVLPMLSEIKQGRISRSRRITGPEHNPHGKSYHPLPMALLTVTYSLIDQWLSHVFISRRRLSQNRLLLFDRHPRELVLDPKRFRFPGPAWLARLLAWLMPRPDLVVLLDSPAEVLQQRKQEVPLEETQRQQKAYYESVDRLPRGRVVDGTQSPEVIAEEVRRLILEELRVRMLRRFSSESAT